MSNALNWFEIPVTDLARASAQGAIIYLDAGDDLAGALSRVEAAGGKVVMGATHLSDQIGSIALFLDSEGNRAAFHSRRYPPAPDPRWAPPSSPAVSSPGEEGGSAS